MRFIHRGMIEKAPIFRQKRCQRLTFRVRPIAGDQHPKPLAQRGRVYSSDAYVSAVTTVALTATYRTFPYQPGDDALSQCWIPKTILTAVLFNHCQQKRDKWRVFLGGA